MTVIAEILVGLVAALQAYFLIMEMFLWQTPGVRRSLGLTSEFAKQTASLAKNQGLYNGFLSAGLVWGLYARDPLDFQIKIFFLVCILVAGLYGAATASRQILFVQALPALLALAALVASR
ncbi:MAG: DUF1304 domain-containing protein [Deltaproteobacteria bacterium]|nr:DUF1304 domain-containing protein [Deltaproteobacteria bacterium]MBI3295457.1 DUF1304 domain-containing protein [Deltaproteobacteria bacterium]